MITTITVVSLALACAVLGVLLRSQSIKTNRSHSREEQLRAELDQAKALLAEARTENARLDERLTIMTGEQQKLVQESEQRFRALADSALAQNGDALRRQNVDTLAEALKPMRENFEQFRRTFAERTERDTAERLSLDRRVRELADLNAVIGRETRRLTDALKGNAKVQGDWGEMILENILERCGLRRGQEYVVQAGVCTDSGRRLRPDVVINYTEGRKIIVDSKVSIQHYLAMLDATDECGRRTFGREHVASVRKHIAELRDKSYQDFVGEARVDFVLMFIPHEGAYLTAMQLDPDLWESAYQAGVLIVAPTHLMGVVRLVEQMWRHDKQNRHALEIARQAGLMLDKLRGFLDDMDKMDRAIASSREAWNDAYGKLTGGTGNLIGRALRLEELGAKAKKALPDRYRDAAGAGNDDD